MSAEIGLTQEDRESGFGQRTTPVSAPSISGLERAAVEEVLHSGWITQGQRVREFESCFSSFIGCKYGVACSSGTAALHLALRALDITHWDEVLIPDISFIATANAVRYCGAKPVLCDIDPDTWGISVEDAKRKKTVRTRAIIAVHLYGRRCDISGLMRLGVPIIEDAAQAIGLTSLGCGTVAATFSFYGNKVLTTGEGGMVVTDHPAIARAAESLRGHAMHETRRYFHTELGFNYRMTDIQAALGLAQLMRIDELLEKRRRVCMRYSSYLPETWTRDSLPAPWLFTVLTSERTALVKKLTEHGIETRTCFEPFHRMPMYHAPSRYFPEAERLAQQVLSLPTYPDLPLDEVDRIVRVIKET